MYVARFDLMAIIVEIYCWVLELASKLVRFVRWQLQLNAGVPDWYVEDRISSKVYNGFFVIYDNWHLPKKSVRGRVVEWPNLPTDVYIYDPPAALRGHPHGSCLQLLTPGDAWFKLHWQKPARNFAETCAYIEQLLDEVS